MNIVDITKLARCQLNRARSGIFRQAMPLGAALTRPTPRPLGPLIQPAKIDFQAPTCVDRCYTEDATAPDTDRKAAVARGR